MIVQILIPIFLIVEFYACYSFSCIIDDIVKLEKDTKEIRHEIEKQRNIDREGSND